MNNFRSTDIFVKISTNIFVKISTNIFVKISTNIFVKISTNISDIFIKFKYRYIYIYLYFHPYKTCSLPNIFCIILIKIFNHLSPLFLGILNTFVLINTHPFHLNSLPKPLTTFSFFLSLFNSLLGLTLDAHPVIIDLGYVWFSENLKEKLKKRK